MSEEESKPISEEAVATEVVEQPEGKKKKEKSKARKIVEWVLFGIFLVIFGVFAVGTIDGMVHKKENSNQTLRFGVGTFFILTDSMEPKYMKNDAILTYKEGINKLISDLEKQPGAIIAKDDAEEKIIALTEEHSLDMAFYNIDTNVNPFNIDYYFDEYDPHLSEYSEVIVTGKMMTHRIREMHIYKNAKYGSGKYIFITSGINHKGLASLKGQYQIVTEKQYVGIVKMDSLVLGHIFLFMSSIWGLLILLLIPAMYLIVTSGIDIFKTLKASEEAEETAPKQKVESIEGISGKDRERLKQELLDEMIAKKKEGEHKDEEH